MEETLDIKRLRYHHTIYEELMKTMEAHNLTTGDFAGKFPRASVIRSTDLYYSHHYVVWLSDGTREGKKISQFTITEAGELKYK